MVNLADAYRWSAQQDKARETYQKAISLGFKELQTNPQDAEVMAQIALSYAKTGDSKQASDFLRRARTIDKENVEYIYDEAMIDALANRTADAFKSLEEALQKNYPAEAAAGDPELGSIQRDPRFNTLIQKYSKKK
jgi:tetratricopeptide (TPR) repeat protein